MTTRLFPIVTALLLLGAPGAALAEALVICHVGGPGSAAQAKPVLDKFMRHIERTARLPAGSMEGEYHTTLKGCLSYIKAKKPLFGVFDLATYLAQARPLKLSPLACMGRPDAQRYHLLVRKGSYKDLAALKGKLLISNHITDPRYVSQVVFEGKVDLAKHFKLKSTRRPLKGLRRVARSRADATLVDQMAYEHLKELKLPAELISIFTSKGLPGLTMVTLGTAKQNRSVVAKVRGAIPKLCADDGRKLCKTFQVDAFTLVKPARYRRLLAHYGR